MARRSIGLLIVMLLLAGCVREVDQGPLLNDENEKDIPLSIEIEANSGETPTKVELEQEEVEEEVIEPNYIELTISAIGDCTLGMDDALLKELSINPNYRTFNQIFEEQNNDYAYFFRLVEPIFSADDLTIANLETTFTTSNEKASKKWRFKGDPSYVNILSEGSIEAVSLANNHIYDYLQQGFNDTKKYLSEAGITYFGEREIGVYEVKGIKVGLLGYQGFTALDPIKKRIKEEIQVLREEGVNLIIISFHWGSEYTNYPNGSQIELGHFAIDEGADLVIGHHPHVIQGIEYYKDKYIVYSLGNFSFGGNLDPVDYDTFIFQQTFRFDLEKELLNEQFISIIPSSISSTKEYNNYQPQPLEGEAYRRVINRINTYSEKLNFSYEEVNNRLRTE